MPNYATQTERYTAAQTYRYIYTIHNCTVRQIPKTDAGKHKVTQADRYTICNLTDRQTDAQSRRLTDRYKIQNQTYKQIHNMYSEYTTTQKDRYIIHSHRPQTFPLESLNPTLLRKKVQLRQSRNMGPALSTITHRIQYTYS